MEDAWIDTTIFKAHSVCGASRTAAAEKGFGLLTYPAQQIGARTLSLNVFTTAPLQAAAMSRQWYSRKREGGG